MNRQLWYLSGAYLPTTSANSVHVMCQCAAYARAGWSVHLIARHARPATDESVHDYYGIAEKFAITRLNRPQIRVVGALVDAFNVLRVVRKAPAGTLIHAREVWALFLVALFTDLEFLYESHWRPGWFRWRIERWLFRRPRCRGVVFISAALEAIYRCRDPGVMAVTRVCIAHDAADAVADSDLHNPVADSSRLTVGYVGNFRPGSGMDLMMDVAARCPNLDFLMIGGTPDEITQLESKYGEHERVNITLLPGVPRSQLGPVYERCHIMAAPYQAGLAHLRWCSPMKLFEYMSFGKAIICADFPVMHEILHNGVSGILVPAENVDAWVAALNQLDADRERVAQLGGAGRAQQRVHYTWDARARRILEALYPEGVG